METHVQAGVPLRTPLAGQAPALRITPESVPVDFGWNQSFETPEEWGQDFTVTYVHGGGPLGEGDVVFIRANFIPFDPSPLEDRLPAARGKEPDLEEIESLPRLYLTAWKAGALGLQTVNPRQANYVELVEAATGATLEVGRPLISNPQFRVVPITVVSGSMKPGEHVTIAVRGACSSALRNPGGICTNAHEHAFVAAVGRQRRGDEEDGYAWQIVDDVRGGWMLPMAPCVVNAVAPSQVQAGVEARLRLCVMDEMDNRVHGWRGTLHLSCTDVQAHFPAAVTLRAQDAGAASVSVTLHTPGVHRFTVHAFEGSFCTGPVQVSTAAPGRQVLWGDYHLHSWRCDGTGDPDRLLEYGREAAFLDWAALTSHDAPAWPFAGAMAWHDIASRIDGAQREGFVTLPAFEWTSSASHDLRSEYETRGDGHRIVLAREWDALLHPFLPTWKDARSDTTWKLLRELIRRDGDAAAPRALVVPHDLMCTNWWALNAQCPERAEPIDAAEQERYAPLAQVYSPLHGNHESPQEGGWRPHSRYYGQPDELAGYVNGLKYGGVYGVAAGADSHAGRPGSFVFGALTAVVAAEHTRAGIFDALRARHTYATSGHRLLMEFSHALPGGGTAIMGDRVEYEAEDALAPALAWRVASPLPIRRVRVVRVRGPMPGERPRQGITEREPEPDPWRFVQYVADESFPAGARRTEVSGYLRDEGFQAAQWPYVSYFLVVEHENTRRHARDVVPANPGDDPADHLQDRGWTSPIFFRRRGGSLPPGAAAEE
ncbi:MAG TPA: DUF3604 domain-containing protein [Longimicrobium sp.]|nr:DUF3604 domain-containing protein [Longimicrobium sp.]